MTASIQKSKNALGARVADLRAGIKKNDQAITVVIQSLGIQSKTPFGQFKSEFSRLSAELAELERQLDRIVSPQRLVANFPLPVAIGNTDGDGRFAVKLAAGDMSRSLQRRGTLVGASKPIIGS